MANCIENVLSQFPEADRKALSDIFDGMTRDAKEGFLDAAGNPDAEFMKKAQARIENHKRGVMIAKIKTLQNVAKEAKNHAFIQQEAFGGKVSEGIQALYTGTHRNIEGAREGISQIARANENKLLRQFEKGLEDTKLKGIDRRQNHQGKVRAREWPHGRDYQRR